MGKEILLEPGLAGRLEKYRVVQQRPLTNGYTGARRSKCKGGAVEFADYREYSAGDEPRRVDWKAYARLGRLYVKEFEDERQDAILFIIDLSASMDWGYDQQHKGLYALRLAAGIGTCVLAGNDRLSVVAGARSSTNNNSSPSEKSSIQSLTSLQGRNSLPRLWNWLGEAAAFGGGTDLAGCLRYGITMAPSAARLLIFSDLMDPAGVEEVLHIAAGRGMAVTLIHILAPGELEPASEGEWTLVDAETGDRVEVSFTPAALQDYAQRLQEFFRQLDDNCRRWGARRLLIDSRQPVAETLLHALPREGVLTVG